MRNIKNHIMGTKCPIDMKQIVLETEFYVTCQNTILPFPSSKQSEQYRCAVMQERTLFLRQKLAHSTVGLLKKLPYFR